MVKVNVKKQSNYPVGSVYLRNKLRKFFESQGIVSDAYVSVSIVGEKKMKEISKRYLGKSELHNVLSFVESDRTREFVYPSETIFLGEIVVCFPLALKEAKSEGVLIREKVYSLIEHGANHLLGKHHD